MQWTHRLRNKLEEKDWAEIKNLTEKVENKVQDILQNSEQKINKWKI